MKENNDKKKDWLKAAKAFAKQAYVDAGRDAIRKERLASERRRALGRTNWR